MSNLILASSSPARHALLSRLKIPFMTISPNIDESRFQNEPPMDFVSRLSEQKAQTIAHQHPTAWVIGSDQICICDNVIWGKPLTLENARTQLSFFSGKTVYFYTGLCLTNLNSHQSFLDVIPYQVHFRSLQPSCIEDYIHSENILECAGSFKAEGLGIRLFEKMAGNDPTSLQGLPLIRLCDFLEWADFFNKPTPSNRLH